MADDEKIDREFEWLNQAQRIGLVVTRSVLSELNLPPEQQTQADTATAAEFISDSRDEPALKDVWGFFERVLNWPQCHVAGAPGGPALPAQVSISLPDLHTLLEPSWAVMDSEDDGKPCLLVRIESPSIELGKRGALEGWEASPHQRFERLLRETGAERGILISDKELRLIHAPKGETSGWIIWPLHALKSVAGRPLLGGLKLMLGRARLFTGPREQRLAAILRKSREAQATVSVALSEQVLGALYELLRGLRQANPDLIDDLARKEPARLYEGMLTVLMRLVFILYAEDRDLIPSQNEGRLRDLYLDNYSVRGLHARLLADKARYPDTMEERVGAWGRLLALFRLIHGGHGSGWIRARGGKLFDPEAFPFLEGRSTGETNVRILKIPDGVLLRILDGLVILKGERLSYRELDVEQIGSVYETVMGFTVERTAGPSLAIKAGKNNRTPVYIDLERLLAQRAEKRIRFLKENAERSSVTDRQERAIKAAKSVGDLVSAFDSMIDERASPGKHLVPNGMPVLQPTDERRGTGSHYTPRSLTEPIVRQALEPVFIRLPVDATPDQVLDIKACDPAMGSGAFLVEACRALARRLQEAWDKHPQLKPKIPPDEDEDLHAKRLVAQRCLYGVDKNPMATDLARLSLWLATLARDHEFTFLDHALKSGDSLVGLTRAQIADLTWGEAEQGKPLFRQLVRDAINAANEGRAAIRSAPDEVTLAIQEFRNRTVEKDLRLARLPGHAIVATYFSAQRDRARRTALQRLQAAFTGRLNPDWAAAEELAVSLMTGDHPLKPFHWEIEFPEVFLRDNPGFDAIVGNPPFAGKNIVAKNNRDGFGEWLKHLHIGSHGNADLVAHFFRRAYSLLREGGAFGLIASNTISQGDTRESGLLRIVLSGGTIYRATRRLKWPGEAAVVVSTVHIAKRLTEKQRPELQIDGREASRISAFLVDGQNDESPSQLTANDDKAFIGTYVLGMGFTFDDAAAAKGTGTPLAEMHRLIASEARNRERIRPYIGGEEINNDPRMNHGRYVIDFEDFPFRRDGGLKSWSLSQTEERSAMLQEGVVPSDYDLPVANDWPELLGIVERLVKPDRDTDNRPHYRKFWWRFAERRRALDRALDRLSRTWALSRVSPMLMIGRASADVTFAESAVVFPFSTFAPLSVLQSRVHEVWARFFSSSLEDRLRYAPSDCFQTFPFPVDFENNEHLEATGRAYHDYRAELMIARNEGMTPTYNRFHDQDCSDLAIARLRELHAEMDRTVLEAYGWVDLAEEMDAIFLDEQNEMEFVYQGRLFWPAPFRDKLLARLLDLNRAQAAEEQAGAAHAAILKSAPVARPKRRGAKQLGFDLGEEKQIDLELED